MIVSERRFQYEEEVRANPLNYDGWFDYIRLEESAGDIERTREVGDSLHPTRLQSSVSRDVLQLPAFFLAMELV